MNRRGLSKIKKYTRISKNPAKFFRREGKRRQNSLLRSILPRGAMRNIRMGTRLFGGKKGRRTQAPAEPRMFEGLEEAPEGEEEVEPGTPRRGVRPIYQRRRELEKVVRVQTMNGERLEFQSNTLAIIQPPSALMRLIKMFLALLLLPLALLMALFGGRKEGGGKGKMGKRLITVDRRGRVQVRNI